VRWGATDAFASLGLSRSAAVSVHQSFIRREKLENAGGCNGCDALGAKALVDIDNSVATYSYLASRGINSLLFSVDTLRDFFAPQHSARIRKIKEQRASMPSSAAEEYELWKQQSNLEEEADSLVIDNVKRTHILAADDGKSAIDLSPSRTWDDGNRSLGITAEVTAGSRPNVIKGNKNTEGFATSEKHDLYARDRFARRLMESGLDAKLHASKRLFEPPRSPSEYSEDVSWFLPALKADIPEAAAMFSNDVGTSGCAMVKPPAGLWEYGGSREGTYVKDELVPASIGSFSVYAVHSWKMSEGSFWLIATTCSEGTGESRYGQLALVSKDEGKAAELWWLSLREHKIVGDLLGIYNAPSLIAEIIDRRFLLLAAEGRNNAIVVDLDARKVTHTFASGSAHDVITRLHLTADGRLIQLNDDGRFYVYSLSQNRRLLNGRYIDDEILFFDDRGYYAGTPEAAHYMYLRFPGVTGYHSLHQFRVALHRPQLIERLLKGEVVDEPAPKLATPPNVEFTATPGVLSGSIRKMGLNIRATASSTLDVVRIFIDGRPAHELKLTSANVAVDHNIDVPESARWIALQAVDTAGYVSIPVTARLSAEKGQNKLGGRVFTLAVGTNNYTDSKLRFLNGTHDDARMFLEITQSAAGKYYVSAENEAPLLDTPGLRQLLPERIRFITARARENDTIMIFLSAHGLKDAGGNFYLATKETRVDDLANTAVSWADMVNALKGARSRIVIFLDACHSGAAGQEVTNNDAMSPVLQSNFAVTVFAASRGREFSLDRVFTPALKKLLTQQRAAIDTNRNGVIELSELYSALKRDVVAFTNGRQTPWIARNDMIGEVPLF
jgi:hypothetical protein